MRPFTPRPMIRLLFFLAAASLASGGETFPDDAAVIAKARAASNAAIAAHDAALAASFLAEDIHVTTGSGMMLEGRDAVRKKFEKQFSAQRDLVYTRTPTHLEISRAAPLAAEHGTWQGHWTDAGKTIEASGDYFAMWRKIGETWLIRSELFVTLDRRENGAAARKN